MGKILNKILNIVGFEGEEGEEEEEDFLFENDHSNKSQFSSMPYDSKKGRIVDIHTTTQFKVVVLQAKRFEDVKDIADHLKNKKPVVVNLEDTEKDVARRMIDFLSGVVYAIDGGIQKISQGILMVTPYNVGILGDFKDELRNKGVFPWETE